MEVTPSPSRCYPSTFCILTDWLTEPATFVPNSSAGSFIWYTIINSSEQNNVSKAFDPGQIKGDEMLSLRITETRAESSFYTTIFHPQYLSKHLCPLTCLCTPRLHAPVRRKKDKCILKKQFWKLEAKGPRAAPVFPLLSLYLCIKLPCKHGSCSASAGVPFSFPFPYFLLRRACGTELTSLIQTPKPDSETLSKQEHKWFWACPRLLR